MIKNKYLYITNYNPEVMAKNQQAIDFLITFGYNNFKFPMRVRLRDKNSIYGTNLMTVPKNWFTYTLKKNIKNEKIHL